MEISTFELLAKPIAPLNLPANVLPVARRVVQGYFLTISNLEPFNVQYRIQFTISKPVQNDPNRIITLGPNKNVGLVVDVAGNNIDIPLTQNGEVYRGTFIIPARQTASVELLPQVLNVLTTGMLLEVRGFVSLFRRKILPGSLRPVKVLLNPEIRGTFLPNGFPLVPNPSPDFDQINYSLAIASGKAFNEIPPEPTQPPIIITPILQPLLEELSNGILDLASLEADNPGKARMLVQLLAELDASDVNLKDLNTVMEKLEIPVRMSSI
ncbi:hypothetical protein K4039_02245 [Lyngbya sp. CCAP 1446/10]|uniref:hypothetical protein n=1 Tax=Lyngbya sp. CCAP 1446/10 TaxID=439293 RepID=UPI002238C64C|nr:hypothetical protein [Lyngbya sp. CCAP 1446/10]MCW6048926.1 hypothetical protein [Lyngbya sp. CCAP 1446/10]